MSCLRCLLPVFLLNPFVSAAETVQLPKRPYQIAIQFSPVGPGKKINIDGRVSVPFSQIVKPGVPSGLTIYEKKSSGWREVSTHKFDAGRGKKSMSFDGEIILSDEKAEFAVHITAVHCHETGKGLCVIDNYQGVVKRSPGSGKQISFDLMATDPNTFR